MEILQLKYFCYAAKMQNFSKTAQHFNVPVSNISQTIKRLENELGTTLFFRSANSLSLNEQGKVFFDYAQRALDLLEEAKLKIDDEEDFSGEIKILISTNRRTVTEFIEKFKLQYGKINFIIKHQNDGDDFDIIISDISPWENAEKILLVEEKMCVAMNKDNPLVKKEDADYSKERFITMPPESSLFRYTKLFCNSLGFEPNVAIQTDDPFYVRKYIEMGMGIAIVPIVSWKGLFSDNIVLKDTNIKRKTYLWWNKNKFLSKSARKFIEMIKDFRQ